jgi:hypothetical protein
MERTLMRSTQLGFLVVFTIRQPTRIDTAESKAAVVAVVCFSVFRNGFYFNVLHNLIVLSETLIAGKRKLIRYSSVVKQHEQ